MSQRYEPIPHAGDEDEDDINFTPIDRPHSPQHQPSHAIPNSPPLSFRSLASSPHRWSTADRDPLVSDADRNLADAFDAPSDSDADEDEVHRLDDRQRIMSGRPSAAASIDVDIDTRISDGGRQPHAETPVTRLPTFAPATLTRAYGGGSVVDGVFANLSAKPERGEEIEEKPPTYEQAAADATPPYWENTIFAPSGAASDEVYIDGLPVGSFFSFIWNGMISMSFQLVGFLLTYLLHSTHAAKNGSKAGLGITLIQYGFSLKGASSSGGTPDSSDDDDSSGDFTSPSDPNNHTFDPNSPVVGSDRGVFISNADGAASSEMGFSALGASDWFAYALMIVGWFVLIRAISEYMKARRHEALVLQSPSRGLNVAVVAEGEEPVHSV